MDLRLDNLPDENLLDLVIWFDDYIDAVSARPRIVALITQLRQALVDELEMRNLFHVRSEGVLHLELPALAELREYERVGSSMIFQAISVEFTGPVNELFLGLARGIMSIQA